MSVPIILASGSSIRRTLLESAGLDFDVVNARIDEETVRDALLEENASPRDIADALAELKAQKVSAKHLDALVIGCDQVLNFEGRIISKPTSKDALQEQLKDMRGNRHELLSAVVVYEQGKPVWRHVGVVRMTMRNFSDSYLEDYLTRNWESVRDAAGGYKLEEEGVRLFAAVHGDYFNVLGLPLIELLSYFGVRGVIEQ